jgi:ABC-2 type transport system ATP-binding protein
VAMGLVHRPQVLFLDEPTSGLDPEARADMWKEIAHLAGEEGLTILLTTHYLEEADKLARRLAIVDRGRVVAQGTPDALKGELHGDALHVEIGSDDGSSAEGREGCEDRVRAALAGVSEVRDLVIENDRLLHVHADNGARAVPVMLQALETHGIAVASVTVARPSLDDVYLQYTGRTFESAEAESAEAKKR